MTLKVQKIYNK